MEKKKILIVEDDQGLQAALNEVLKDAGYEIAVALDGEEGLRKLKEIKPHLILLDLILPRLDGFKFLELMKETPEVAHTPVIVLTNLESQQDIERAVALGAKTYLVKTNYSLNEVVEKVKKALE